MRARAADNRCVDPLGRADLRARVDAARERITAPGGRGTMGFALVLLRRS